jgi:acyl-CoA hydrolase
VDHFISNDHDLPTIERPTPSQEDRRIAEYIADLIANGSTIQLGIGGIPNAIGDALKNHRDLGVHTEMINDTIMDLYLKGIVTGRMKSIWPGKIVGSFIYGTKALYEFAHDNPALELHPSSVVNDPYRLGRNYKMVSVNTAVEVDLTGQVCSESVGHAELSGVGGAFETHIGAQRSEGGRGIIALRSTTGGPSPQSKIVFELKPGAKVSVSRNDVDTIVTEYGVAQLMGKSVGERVKAMTAIAHPDFREDLLVQAKKVGYL